MGEQPYAVVLWCCGAVVLWCCSPNSVKSLTSDSNNSKIESPTGLCSKRSSTPAAAARQDTRSCGRRERSFQRQYFLFNFAIGQLHV